MKKQSLDELQKSLDILRWERTSHGDKHQADLDELAIHSLLRACVMRNMQKYAEAAQILKTDLLSHEKYIPPIRHSHQTLTIARHDFKGPLKDDWTLPSAHYEMAVLAWNEKDAEGADHKGKVMECQQWLEKVQKWGDAYSLDTRMSFKIGTSLQTLKRHRKIMGF